jgi:hypothetical protein
MNVAKLAAFAGITAVLGIGLGACGGSTASPSIKPVSNPSSATSAPAATASAPAATASAADVASGIKEGDNQKLTDSTSPYYGNGVTVTDVGCVANSGVNTFTCLVTTSDGLNTTVTATVSPDGSMIWS